MIQKRIHQLLIEIDQICKKNDITYFLSKETLLYGYLRGTYDKSTHCGNILIMASDAEKMFDCLNDVNNPHRCVESWKNSKNYPDYTIRYYDTQTTCYNVLDCLNYENHGIYVEIQILKGKINGMKGKLSRVLERGMILTSYHERPSFNEVKNRYDFTAKWIYRLCSTFLGKQTIRKNLFSFISQNEMTPYSVVDSPVGSWVFCENGSNSKKMTLKFFSGRKQCIVDGYEFYVPLYALTFLKQIYPSRFVLYDSYIKANLDYYNNCIINENIPFRKTSEMEKSERDLIKRLTEKNRERYSIKKRERDYTRIAKSDWNIVKATNNKYLLENTYLDKIPQLKDLENKQLWDEIMVQLDDMNTLIEKSVREKSILYVDSVLMEIYINALEHLGEYNKVNRIIQWIS